MEFTRAKLAILKQLKTPEKLQAFLDFDIADNKEPHGPTCRSPRYVLRDRVAHCAEGAFFAAAALRVHGHPPLIVDLETGRDDDHLLAVFKEHNHWGAIARSNYAGLDSFKGCLKSAQAGQKKFRVGFAQKSSKIGGNFTTQAGV